MPHHWFQMICHSDVEFINKQVLHCSYVLSFYITSLMLSLLRSSILFSCNVMYPVIYVLNSFSALVLSVISCMLCNIMALIYHPIFGNFHIDMQRHVRRNLWFHRLKSFYWVSDLSIIFTRSSLSMAIFIHWQNLHEDMCSKAEKVT